MLTNPNQLVAPNRPVIDEERNPITVLNPLRVPDNGTYPIDLDDQSTADGFTGGVVSDLLIGPNSGLTLINETGDNPKTVELIFNRTIIASGVAISTLTGTFSNVKIEALLAPGFYRTVRDESADNAPKVGAFYAFSIASEGANIGIIGFSGLRITFNTTGQASVSNIDIQKLGSSISTLQALKPDGTATFIGATNNDNLKVSLQEYGDTPAIDAFDAQRVSQKFTLFDSKQLHDKQPIFWNEVVGGSATSIHNPVEASTTMTVTANAADYVIRQTKQRFNYQPGKGQLIFQTFQGAHTPGLTKRVGSFDGIGANALTPNNGIFFETDGVLSWNICKNGVITETATQAEWNVDRLDGTGKSGIVLDLDSAQIAIVDWEWLGVGRVRAGFVIDGLIYYTHYFQHANDPNFPTVYMSTPNLPLRYSIETDGTVGGSLQHICSTVISEGGIEKTGVLRSVESADTSESGYNGTGSKYALCGIRLKTTHLDISVIPEDIQVVLTTNDSFKWELHLNPTITGTFAYQDLDSSSIQYAQALGNNPQVTTDGLIVGRGGGSSQQRASTDDLRTALRIGSMISGDRDELVLVMVPLSGNLTAWACLNFRELL